MNQQSVTSEGVFKDLAAQGFTALSKYVKQMNEAQDMGFWGADHEEIRKGVFRYADFSGQVWMKDRAQVATFLTEMAKKKTSFSLDDRQRKLLKQAGNGNLKRGLENLINMYEGALNGNATRTET